VAVLVGVVVTQRANDLVASGSAPLAAQVGGLQLAFLIAAAVALIGSLVALVALRSSKRNMLPAPADVAMEARS
jgi:hypothetical protein